ncbi:hypothetical protein [Bacillus cereus]|uniref:hypothetical protein n=1 Tax=Bacillus cereus TaxID=1396 RepID=UPI001CC0A3E4|nr:hypothetical protein [Bacillus cereus]
MFKKLVVGALATGIALTGGIGATSASAEEVKPVNPKNLSVCDVPYKKIGENKYENYIYDSSGYYADYYTEYICGGYMHWYFKGTTPGGDARYEGRMVY